MRRSVRLVWAQAPGGVIGVDGTLPWDLPEDRRLFRALTLGSTVVMGRRTWESLPPRSRPLPGRRNVVLSTTLGAVEGAHVATSVDEVLDGVLDGVLDDGPDDLWVIGGRGVYEAFLPHADDVVVTDLADDVPGDTVAPALDGSWTPGLRVPDDGWLASSTGLRYRVTWWHRADRPATGHVPALLAEVFPELAGRPGAGTRRG